MKQLNACYACGTIKGTGEKISTRAEKPAEAPNSPPKAELIDAPAEVRGEEERNLQLVSGLGGMSESRPKKATPDKGRAAPTLESEA